MKIVLPIAGKGQRFADAGIATPKPLVTVLGKTLLELSLESLGIDGDLVIVANHYQDEKYNNAVRAIAKSYYPKAEIKYVYGKQFGAAYTSLQAGDLIDNDQLIITNCDQILKWDSYKFNRSLSADGAVVIYNSYDTRNSFAKIENGVVVEIAEKKRISTNALIGMHYWRNGLDFKRSARRLVSDMNYKAEAYVSETYNYLIDEGMTIHPYTIPNSEFISLGTPEAVSAFLGSSDWIKEAEYGD